MSTLERTMTASPAAPGLVLVLAFLVTGCGGGTSPATPTAPEATRPAAPDAPGATVAGVDAPPDAALAAEGGDPVVGQLGTYTWLGSGSDAPWLPGSPIAVGAGEPLTIAFRPAGDIAAWEARVTQAGAEGPDGAEPLGSGRGDPAFAAPGAGDWTVEVQVTFLADIGTASYFWRLDVR